MHVAVLPSCSPKKQAKQLHPPKVFIQEIGNSNNSLPKPSLEFIFTFYILENSKYIPHLHQPPLSLVEFAPTSQAKVLNGLQVDQDVFKLSKQKEAGRHAPGRGSAWEDWILGHTSLTDCACFFGVEILNQPHQLQSSGYFVRNKNIQMYSL